MTEISIITPAYNAEKYIARCMESVLKQTYKNFEHIIVNDGSMDNTLKICMDMAEKDQRIKIIDKKNEGVSKARNEALKIANGKYIFFADADDWLEPNMLEIMYKEITQKDYDIAVCGYNNYYENTKKTESIYLDKFEERSFVSLISDNSTKYGGFPWNKLIKHELIKKMFNENVHYFENLLFFMENCNNETKYVVVKDPLYNYCINDTSAVHTKKYSLKKISTLDAMEIVIPLLPSENVDIHKYIFICSYYENLHYIKACKFDRSVIYKFLNKKNEYYKEIKKSSKLTKKQKIKLFVLARLNFIYSCAKKIR
ncbi:MAG: glycosyltransferase family 2 protein [Clostridia bacterium]|nr:glycosyltransferase family 2 protein [Clostridia bacterium]